MTTTPERPQRRVGVKPSIPRSDRKDALIVTCLICKLAWDMDFDPPRCTNPDHPQAINAMSEGLKG